MDISQTIETFWFAISIIGLLFAIPGITSNFFVLFCNVMDWNKRNWKYVPFSGAVGGVVFVFALPPSIWDISWGWAILPVVLDFATVLKVVSLLRRDS